MKNASTILLTLSLAVLFGACRKSPAVPSVVSNALYARYPDVSGVDWERVHQGYEAEFGPGKAEVTVYIDTLGHILRRKSEVQAGQLPSAVLLRLREVHKDALIDEAEIVEAADARYYQVELERKGAPDTTLILDAAGDALPATSGWD